MEKKEFNMVLLPEGAVVVTKAEIEAMDIYSEKVRSETIKAIFDDVEELLQMAINTEGRKAAFYETPKHKYAQRLCQTLVADLRKIERKYT